MNKISLLIFSFLLLLVSCKKNEETNILQYKQSFDKLLDIKNYIIKDKRNINDSLYEFEGTNDNYRLTGIYNKVTFEKSGWWILYSKRQDHKLLKVEYINDGEKSVKNQIIFYNDRNIDTLSSKFYEKRIINNNKVLYRFYTPIKAYNNSQLYTHLIYAFYKDNNDLQKENIELQKEGSHYTTIVNIPPSKKFFKALFTESEVNIKNSSEGINQIFIEDTVK
jgi:hypothetical protein